MIRFMTTRAYSGEPGTPFGLEVEFLWSFFASREGRRNGFDSVIEAAAVFYLAKGLDECVLH